VTIKKSTEKYPCRRFIRNSWTVQGFSQWNSESRGPRLWCCFYSIVYESLIWSAKLIIPVRHPLTQRENENKLWQYVSFHLVPEKPFNVEVGVKFHHNERRIKDYRSSDRNLSVSLMDWAIVGRLSWTKCFSNFFTRSRCCGIIHNKHFFYHGKATIWRQFPRLLYKFIDCLVWFLTILGLFNSFFIIKVLHFKCAAVFTFSSQPVGSVLHRLQPPFSIEYKVDERLINKS